MKNTIAASTNQLDGLTYSPNPQSVQRDEKRAYSCHDRHTMEHDGKKSLEAGRNDHVSKPLKPDVLLQSIMQWIPLSRTAHEPDTCIKDSDSAGALELPSPSLSIDEDVVVDVEVALERLGGNKKLYLRLLRDFLHNNSDFHQRLTESVTNKRLEETQYMIHTLQGESGSIGAVSVQEAAQTMEEALLLEKEDVPLLLAVLEHKLHATIQSLSAYANSEVHYEKRVSPGESQSIDIDSTLSGIEHLASLIKIHDLSSINAFADLRQRMSRIMPRETKKLGDLIRRLDFKRALLALREIHKGAALLWENMVDGQ